VALPIASEYINDGFNTTLIIFGTGSNSRNGNFSFRRIMFGSNNLYSGYIYSNGIVTANSNDPSAPQLLNQTLTFNNQSLILDNVVYKS
jgi:hypothetical protein